MNIDYNVLRGCYLYFKYGVIALFNAVPSILYVSLFLVFIIGLIGLLYLVDIKRAFRLTSKLFLAEYVILLFSSTVLSRDVREACGYNLKPFWSYSDFLNGNLYLIAENLLNIIAFIPVGLLLGLSFVNIKWWKVLLLAIGFSMSIEVAQLLLSKGFAELDDVMHNTIGAMIGYGMALLFKKMYRYLIPKTAITQRI